MTHENEDTFEGLRIRYPQRPPSATTAPLNSTRELLPPEMLEQRDAALASLAIQAQQVPPDDIAVT